MNRKSKSKCLSSTLIFGFLLLLIGGSSIESDGIGFVIAAIIVVVGLVIMCVSASFLREEDYE